MSMIHISRASDTITRLQQMIGNLQYLSSQQSSAIVHVQDIGFVTPLAITPVAAMINKKSLTHDYRGENNSYLDTIHFPQGIGEVEKLSLKRTYLPIIHLPLQGLDQAQSAKFLGQLSSAYLSLLKNNVIADPLFLQLITTSTFSLLLDEMIDNIQEHAEAENVYLFAQYWKKSNSCEFCLLDDGQGLLGSLQRAGREVKDSEDALRKILESGLSAKTDYGDIRRGTGIRTTRALITNREIHGEFFIMSGDAAFLHSASQGQKFFRFSKYFWNGTIVMGKLNRPPSQFQWSDYVQR
jgi:hypothetical protein